MHLAKKPVAGEALLKIVLEIVTFHDPFSSSSGIKRLMKEENENANAKRDEKKPKSFEDTLFAKGAGGA